MQGSRSQVERNEESEAIYCLKANSESYSELCEECTLYGLVGCDHCQNDAIDVAIKALEEVQQYRKLGTVEKITASMEELKRWHTNKIAPNVKNPFAYTSTLCCCNCDHKDEYIEELEAVVEQYHAGTLPGHTNDDQPLDMTDEELAARAGISPSSVQGVKAPTDQNLAAHDPASIVKFLTNLKADYICSGLACSKCKYVSQCTSGEMSFKIAIDKAIAFINGGTAE